MSLCLAGMAKSVKIAATVFTLSWTHTVQKSAWQEDWRIEGNSLVLEQARVQGSGAGMDPPDGAVLRDSFYRWTPDLAPIPELVLRRAPEAGDWRLCAGGECRGIGEWLGEASDPVTLAPCGD